MNAFGDEQRGWYWRGDVGPDLAAMQRQHDAYAAALRAEGVEVVYLDEIAPGKMKSCYTRDAVVGVGGGAMVMRLGPRIRRGEELAATRTLARLGCPILRTISGSGIAEGGSFAWLDSRTAVLGLSSRVNEEGARQIEEVMRSQGVELIKIHLTGYRLHIDGLFVMVAPDLALANITLLPFWFLERLEGDEDLADRDRAGRRRRHHQLARHRSGPGDDARRGLGPDRGPTRAARRRGDHRALRACHLGRRRPALLDRAADPRRGLTAMASEWTPAQVSALAWLDRNRTALSADHMTIWNFHEPSWREYKSSAWYMDRLEREGFSVERGTAGMPTAFRARWSNGPGPVLAGYAEYDAVPGQSQAPVPHRKPRDGTTALAAGHTDPHSALGLGQFARLPRRQARHGGGRDRWHAGLLRRAGREDVRRQARPCRAWLL